MPIILILFWYFGNRKVAKSSKSIITENILSGILWLHYRVYFQFINNSQIRFSLILCCHFGNILATKSIRKSSTRYFVTKSIRKSKSIITENILTYVCYNTVMVWIMALVVINNAHFSNTFSILCWYFWQQKVSKSSKSIITENILSGIFMTPLSCVFLVY